MSLLVVGSVAFDSIRTPGGQVDDILGGAASYFSVAASFFTRVSLVAVVGEDFTPEHLQVLSSREIDLRGLERAPGRTFRWAGEYSEDMNHRTTLDTQLNVFADFSPKIPADYASSRYLFLGNIHPVLQRQVLEQVRKPHLTGCDTMNFWIEGQRPELLETLRQVDVLVINDQETCQLAGEKRLFQAAQRILEMGPQYLIVKRGEFGAILISRTMKFYVPAYPLDKVVDPTGAGDSFAGGMMGYLASIDRHDAASLKRALIYGSVLASYSVEEFGLQRLSRLHFEEIRSRYRDFCAMTQLEE